jgi:hypothetical protein
VEFNAETEKQFNDWFQRTDYQEPQIDIEIKDEIEEDE